MDFQTHLLEMGYTTIIKDNNRFCRHFTELTLVQFCCPEDGDQNYLKHCLINLELKKEYDKLFFQKSF